MTGAESIYKHTQVGWIILIAMTPVIMVLGFRAVVSPAPPITFTALGLLIVLLLFGSLTVTADNREVSLYFGPGLIRKRYPLSEIGSISQVRNPWYCGWGIRWFGKGWLYNVSGLDAIELRLKNGKQIRIGTDEPERLLQFLSSRIKF